MSLNQIINDGNSSEKWKNLRCNDLIVDGSLSADSVSVSSGIQSIECDLTGFNSNSLNKATLQYQKIGNQVTVFIPRVQIPSADQVDSEPLNIVGLPLNIRPTNNIYSTLPVRDGNDNIELGTIIIFAVNSEISIWEGLNSNQGGIDSGASNIAGMETTLAISYLTN